MRDRSQEFIKTASSAYSSTSSDADFSKFLGELKKYKNLIDEIQSLINRRKKRTEILDFNRIETMFQQLIPVLNCIMA